MSDSLNSSVLESLGELKGELRTMHQSTLSAIANIRDDMRRMEEHNRQNMRDLEGRTDSKIKSVSDRVTTLETKANESTVSQAKQQVITGGLTSGAIVAVVEFIKRMT